MYPVANAFNAANHLYWDTKKFPASVWMHFQRPHCLQMIGFKNREIYATPKSVRVIGSNNCDCINCNCVNCDCDCINWSTLLTVEDTGFSESYGFRNWTIPAEKRLMFSCIGLMWPIKPSEGTRVAVQEIFMIAVFFSRDGKF